MGHQIIQKPNGKFVVWSTVVDDFIIDEATEDQLVSYYMKKAAEEEEARVRKIVEQLRKGEKPYFQFTMDYKEACQTRDSVHGRKPG